MYLLNGSFDVNELGESIVKEEEDIINIHFTTTITDSSQIGRGALLLACTSNKHEEDRVKEQLLGVGWRSVATEVGGLVGELPGKVSRAVIGAALNGRVVDKNPREMHALMHATAEAMNGFISHTMIEASVGAKIAIVRNNHWLSVAVVGDTAYHAVAHHERAGLGTMHI